MENVFSKLQYIFLQCFLLKYGICCIVFLVQIVGCEEE